MPTEAALRTVTLPDRIWQLIKGELENAITEIEESLPYVHKDRRERNGQLLQDLVDAHTMLEEPAEVSLHGIADVLIGHPDPKPGDVKAMSRGLLSAPVPAEVRDSPYVGNLRQAVHDLLLITP